MKINSIIHWFIVLNFTTSIFFSDTVSSAERVNTSYNPFSSKADEGNDEVALPNLESLLTKPSVPSEPETVTEEASPLNEEPQAFLYVLPKGPTYSSSNQAVSEKTSREIAEGPSVSGDSNQVLRNAAAESRQPLLINFNNVSIIEYIRFVSRISNRNFIFDENDLQFNVTIISEEPASIENIMTALLQELRIHDLILIEDGNNLIIHKNSKVSAISTVVGEDFQGTRFNDADIITQVFRLNTLDPDKAAIILRPLVSENALVEVLKDSNHLIVTDLTSNVEKIAQLIKSIDAPNSGVVIGQYVSHTTSIDILIPLAQQIMLPIALDQSLTFVPHPATNSIYIIASPFLVERTIAILQHLDQDQGVTRILNLNDLKMGATSTQEAKTSGKGNVVPTSGAGSLFISPTSLLKSGSGEWVQDENGNWIYKPALTPAELELLRRQGQNATLKGNWTRDYNNVWGFTPGEEISPGAGPKGRWILNKDGNWIYQLASDETFNPGTLTRQFEGRPNLPGGAQKPTKFYIYKLKYRKGDTIETVLRQIADTIQQNERGNEDLITTLRSVQWLTEPNSLVFSGTVDSLDKARELVTEVDVPIRQVFIEMLILETTLADSLQYGVSYGTRFGGGDVTGSQGFFSGSTTLLGALATTGFSNLGSTVGTLSPLVPNGTNLAQTSGFNLGVIGQKLTHCGTEFGSIGALVNAVHDRTKDKVVSNPKLLVEDNSPAEIFVGLNTPYRTQSIANDLGSVLTSNFEYRDIGTHLKVTPYLGNGDIVALDIEEEVSTIIAGLITNADTASTSPGPTTRINRTSTRVHIPDNYFLVISGLMQNEEARERNQVPCIGGIPMLGAAFSSKINTDNGRNLMIFIRPMIVDTNEQIQSLTKHQQDIYDYGNTFKNSDDYETSEALDLFNLSQTWNPEDAQTDEDRYN